MNKMTRRRMACELELHGAIYPRSLWYVEMVNDEVQWAKQYHLLRGWEPRKVFEFDMRLQSRKSVLAKTTLHNYEILKHGYDDRVIMIHDTVENHAVWVAKRILSF